MLLPLEGEEPLLKSKYQLKQFNTLKLKAEKEADKVLA